MIEIFYLFFFFYFYIYSHVYTLFGPPTPTPHPPPPSVFGAEPVLSSCSPIFVEDIVSLLVCDKDTYTALLPCTCVLQPTCSSQLLSPLLIVASASFRLLYSFLYSEHINHIQVLAFLHFPYLSCVSSPLSV
jgi:hypothetical protein